LLESSWRWKMLAPGVAGIPAHVTKSYCSSAAPLAGEDQSEGDICRSLPMEHIDNRYEKQRH
jgi:hypothetical protein